MRKTIGLMAKKTFFTGTTWNTSVSRLTFYAVVLFLVSILGFVASHRASTSPDFSSIDDYSSMIVVNAPHSFMLFLENDTFFEDIVIINDTHHAAYDFNYFNRSMNTHNAFMTIIFPEDFDEQLHDPSVTDKSLLMTYFNIQDAELMNKHDQYTEYIDIYYNIFLLESMGVPTIGSSLFYSTLNYTFFTESTIYSAYYLTVRMIAPLVIFILVLFVSMESGVVAIAGEKEKNTFARLLLTPVSRFEIVLGHVLGVCLRSIIFPIIIIFAMLLFTEMTVISAFIVTGVVVSLVYLISAIIIMISVMGKNIVSAQTAFLPIFLIILMVCVFSMQTHFSPTFIYLVIPFFGHFNVMVSGFFGQFLPLEFILLSLISILIGTIIIVVTERLLSSERFTVLSDGESARDMFKARKLLKKEQRLHALSKERSIFGYRIKRVKNPITNIAYHFWFPLAALSFFQLISLILPIRAFFRQESATAFFQSIAKMLEQQRLNDLSEVAYDFMALLMQQPAFLISMSFGYVGMILLYLFVVKVIEKNSARTLGFPFKTKVERKKALINYGKGLLIGMLMIIGIYLFLLIFGQIKPIGFQLRASSIGLFFAYIIMWIPQGAAEEVMMRGYMMPRIAARFGKPAGVFLSSLLFSLLHAGNPGFNFIAFINLIIISFFFAWITLRTQEIFLVCAAHTAWNFTQGNILGLTVSGSTGTANLIGTEYTSRASDLLTGGSFGPEGGLAVTVVTLIGLSILFITRKRQEKTKNYLPHNLSNN